MYPLTLATEFRFQKRSVFSLAQVFLSLIMLLQLWKGFKGGVPWKGSESQVYVALTECIWHAAEAPLKVSHFL